MFNIRHAPFFWRFRRLGDNLGLFATSQHDSLYNMLELPEMEVEKVCLFELYVVWECWWIWGADGDPNALYGAYAQEIKYDGCWRIYLNLSSVWVLEQGLWYMRASYNFLGPSLIIKDIGNVRTGQDTSFQHFNTHPQRQQTQIP